MERFSPSSGAPPTEITQDERDHSAGLLSQRFPSSGNSARKRRLAKAIKAVFERGKTKGAAGFARFKSWARFPGFGFKAHGDGWRFPPGAEWHDGKLRRQGGGIKARELAAP